MKLTKRQVALKHGFRSGLEDDIAASLTERGVQYEYEKLVLRYTRPETQHRYTPDFVYQTKSGKNIIVESKGRWLTADRKKMALVKEQHPDLDIRMVFSNSRTKISPKSQTTYGMWADKLGIPYADRDIPTAWILE